MYCWNLRKELLCLRTLYNYYACTEEEEEEVSTLMTELSVGIVLFAT